MKHALRVLLILPLAMGGCHEPKAEEPELPAAPAKLYQPFLDKTDIPSRTVIFPDYRLNVGDIIEVIYHVRFEMDEKAYRLKVEDVINVAFPFQEDFNQIAQVQSDGTIRLMLLGDLPAHGKTADELELIVRKAYASLMKDPQLTITFQKANIKIEELKKAITTAPRGQSRLMPIKPDGTIDLAYIGQVSAFGKTVAELREEINNGYADIDFPEIDVTVQVNGVASQKVYVMGAVYAPGVIETKTPLTLLQTLAAAGGSTPRAEPSKVLLVRRKGMPVPQATIINVSDLLNPPIPKANDAPAITAFQYDIWMEDYDLIYVPDSGLAQFDDWVDQVFTRGIRSILPYSWNMGLNFGYEIRSDPTTVTSKTRDNRSLNVQLGP